MGKMLRLVNGIPRMVDESASPTIYDDYLLVKISGASGPNEINESDAQTGDEIALSNSGTYESAELEVRLNGQRLRPVNDYNYVGSGTRTKISMTFDLIAGDRIDFRVDRGA